MKIISVKERLPENDRYVLARTPGRPWIDEDDQEGCFWSVVKFVRGISKEERERLPKNNPRKRCHYGEDESFNNRKPYHWETFGPTTFFGQEVDYWCELPRDLPIGD